jgi:hypothetical protein
MKLSLKLAAAVLASTLLTVAHACANTPKAAVFAFQLDDTSLQGSMTGETAGDRARLAMLDAQLQDALARSGRYVPIGAPAGTDMAPGWTCDGCELDVARSIGADVSVIGWVQKVSNLILNINLVMRDVATGQRIAAGSVDIRGDTDESWRRGLSYLLRNRILSGPHER